MTNLANIFIESAWTASLIPLGNDPTFFAMQAFGGYDMRVPCVVAVLGATIGQCFNYLVGRILLFYGHKANITHNVPRYLHFSRLFNRYGLWLLVLSWLPLGKLLPMIAGFGNARLRYVFLLVLAGQAYHYGQYLF